jgi:hypothetical protein
MVKELLTIQKPSLDKILLKPLAPRARTQTALPSTISVISKEFIGKEKAHIQDLSIRIIFGNIIILVDKGITL